MRCEICGKESSEVYEVVYMGKRVYACLECINKYGLIRIRKAGSFSFRNKPIVARKIKEKKINKVNIIKSNVKNKRTFTALNNLPDFVEGYGKLIKSKRESLGLTQEDLSRELKVKVSYIKKIESEVLPPSIDIARKLEKMLKIRLFKEGKEEYKPLSYDEEDLSVTLGDLIKFEDEEESE